MHSNNLRVIGYVTIALILFVATFVIIRWAIDFATWSQLDSGWAQAIGSIIAIYSSFLLFSRQRKHEQQEGRDNDLARRTRAVAAMQDIAFWSLQVMEECVEHKKGERGFRPETDLTQRLDELREMSNRFVEPTADRVIVVAGLYISNALLQTKNDLPYPFIDRDNAGIARMTARNDELREKHNALIKMQQALEQTCIQRGIELDPAGVANA